MRLLVIVSLSAALAACSSRGTPAQDTYIMPKGGMASVPHTMQQPVETPGPTPRAAGGDYYMPKGHGMQSQGHMMKGSGNAADADGRQ